MKMNETPVIAPRPPEVIIEAQQHSVVERPVEASCPTIHSRSQSDTLKKRRMVWRMAIGICALALWLVFFSGGLLLETIEYRAFLAPHAFPNQAEKDKKAGIVAKEYVGTPTFAFIAATLWFTPTNLAFLALFAGLMGGCGSNILYDELPQEEVEQLHPESRKHLSEMPWSAMMRSFIVYLCVIAGLYFAMDDPFKDSTPAQYMRLAGTISVLALLVGYDPTRIKSWVGLIPSPQSQKVTVTGDQQGHLKVEAKQGPVAGSSSNDILATASAEPTESIGTRNGRPEPEKRVRAPNKSR